jgi:hypothetical protein
MPNTGGSEKPAGGISETIPKEPKTGEISAAQEDTDYRICDAFSSIQDLQEMRKSRRRAQNRAS